MTFAVNVQRKWDTQMCSLTLRMNFQTSSAVSLATHFRQEHRQEDAKPVAALIRKLQKTGHVGCADCYDVFGDELFPLIRRIHGNTTHCGKNSDRTVQKAEKHEPTKEEKIAQLKNELDAAVKEQNFERAAELRDTIKGMEA